MARYGYRHRAFTLIELLVVVSIIALLVSILMPALGRARAQAKAVVCLSTVKQWNYAFMLYAEDNNGRFHTEAGLHGQQWVDALWQNLMWDYLSKDKNFYLCPMAAQRAENGLFGTTSRAWTVPSDWVSEAYSAIYGPIFSCSFGQNNYLQNPLPSWLAAVGDIETKKYITQASAARNPYNTPVLGDSRWRANLCNPTDEPPQYPDEECTHDSSMDRYCIDRHNGTINMAFLDGSARRVGLKELWRLEWHRTFFEQGIPEPVWPAWMASLP